MQNFIWTLAAVIAAWFIALTINRNIFSHSNIDPIVQGLAEIKDIDLDNQCGTDVAKNEMVDYKLTEQGQLVYLCPVGLWPVQKEGVARTVSANFRNRLNPMQRAKFNVYYPEPVPQQTTETPAP